MKNIFFTQILEWILNWEIKNYRSELTDAKLKSVNENITIYYKDTIKPYLDYAISKYGKNFIEKYEKGILSLQE